jgi:outer membrane lipoprotein-sorting protein
VEVRMRVGRLLGGIKIEQMLKAAETAMSKAKGIEGEMIVVLDDRTVRAHVKSLPDGKHFVIDQTMQHGKYKNTMRILGDGETVWADMIDQAVAPGQKRVIQKHTIANIEKRNGEPIRNPLDQAGDVRLFVYNEPTEMKLGDEEVFVLEGTLKKGLKKEQRPGSFVASIVNSDSTARLSFLKSNMMLRKMEIDTGETRLLLEVYNVRFDKSFDSKLFEYAPPVDAELIDLGESAKKGTQVFDGWALPYSRTER